MRIGDGECVSVPKGLTNVGPTAGWQRGDRVIDVAATLKPGTVIANFVFTDGRWQYPHGQHVNAHGYHGALFMGADSFAGGKATRIQMFDQWNSNGGKWRSPRWIGVASPTSSNKPCDRAEDFYVVLIR